MEPWVTLVIAGAAIAGYGWLKPEPKAQSAAVVNEEAYDRLLEDLETENRELVDAVAVFKREQDETVSRLGLRIQELERQMEETAAHRKADAHGRGELAATREMARSPEEPKPAVVRQAASERLKEEGLSAGGSADTAARFAQPADATAEARLAGHLAARIQEAENLPPLAVAADAAATAPAESRAAPSDGPSAISERYAELLELHERGRSVEQIAKAMNMNKGEVQLILQLAKREVNRP